MDFPDPNAKTNAKAQEHRESNESRIQELEKRVDKLCKVIVHLTERLHFEESKETISYQTYENIMMDLPT